MLAILAILGVPLWLILGWLGARLWHRHEIKQLPRLFKIKVRMVSGTYRYVDNEFSRIAGYAIWAHDVLIMEKGFMLPRVLHFPVTAGLEAAQTADREQVKGLGDSPVTLRFSLDNEAVIEVAAPGELSAQAQGPFFSNTTSMDNTGDVPSDAGRQAV